MNGIVVYSITLENVFQTCEKYFSHANKLLHVLAECSASECSLTSQSHDSFILIRPHSHPPVRLRCAWSTIKANLKAMS